MRELRDSGELIRLAYNAMRQMDIDADNVLSTCSMDVADLYDARLRTSFYGQKTFWGGLEDVTCDVLIGLHIGERAPACNWKVLEHIFLSGLTFSDGLAALVRLPYLISDAFSAGIGCDHKGAYLSYSLDEKASRHFVEALMGFLCGFFRFVTNDEFKALAVGFQHSSPCDISKFQQVFHCDVAFSSDENRIYFDQSILQYRILNSSVDMQFHYQGMVESQIAFYEDSKLVQKVRSEIAGLLEQGDAIIHNVSNGLGMDVQILNRRLKSSGTTFNSILDAYRRARARRLLLRTNASVSEIAFLVGFSEPSTFHRAFRRWECVTPSHYRLAKGNDSVSDIVTGRIASDSESHKY